MKDKTPRWQVIDLEQQPPPLPIPNPPQKVEMSKRDLGFNLFLVVLVIGAAMFMFFSPTVFVEADEPPYYDQDFKNRLVSCLKEGWAIEEIKYTSSIDRPEDWKQIYVRIYEVGNAPNYDARYVWYRPGNETEDKESEIICHFFPKD